MFDRQKSIHQPDVAAIITAMTDAEAPFVSETLDAVVRDPGIGEIILCVEEHNAWIEPIVSSLSTDERLKVVRLPLMPLGAVRNRALEQVTLPWVAYCDGDDVWCANKTVIQRSYADATGCDFVGADHYLTDEQGKIRAAAPARYLPMPSSWMVKTAVMKQHPFHEVPFSLKVEESGEWWIRTHNIVRKTRCPKLLLRYRVRANSMSARTPSMQRKTKIVRLGSKPGLGLLILSLTVFQRLFSLKQQYNWQKSWGDPGIQNADSEPMPVVLGQTE